MNVRASDLLAYALLGGSVLVGLLLWSALPDQMAVHFGVNDQPDSFVAKPVGIVLAPGVGLAAVLVTRYAPGWATRTYHSPEVERLTVVFVSAVIAYVQGYVYAWNLGYQVPVSLVVVPVLLGAGALVVYTYTR